MKIIKSKCGWSNEELAVTEFRPAESTGNVLIMHGAGEGSQARCAELAKAITNEGYRVVTFDFSSHGESTGLLEDLTLERRQEQAEAIIKHLDLLKSPLMLIGFSMSGQTAIDVASKLKEVGYLVLFVPAVYSSESRNALFGQESEFTQLIRRPKSWESTDAWQKIGSFKGRCLIFEAENDEVIPKNVPRTLFENLEAAQTAIHVLVKHAPHPIGKWMTDEPKRAEGFAKIIADFHNTGSFNPTKSTQMLEIRIMGQK